MAVSSPVRQRFSGNREELRHTREKHVISPRWLTYGKDSDSVDTKAILGRRLEFTRDLQRLQPNMSFKIKDLRDALASIGKSKGDAWGLGTKSDIASFSKTVAKRIQLLGRHVSQALCRNPRPAWILQLMAAHNNVGVASLTPYR